MMQVSDHGSKQMLLFVMPVPLNPDLLHCPVGVLTMVHPICDNKLADRLTALQIAMLFMAYFL